MRILQVLHDVPYPPRGGGRVDMWGRLRALTSLGHEVDVLIALRGQLEPQARHTISKYARDVLICPRIPMWKGLFGTTPCQVMARLPLKTVSLDSHYDIALLEGDAVGAVLANPTLRCNLRILRTHNNEARYHEERGQIAASPAQVRAYDWIEARRYRRYSARLMEECDAVWWVSLDEMAEASTNAELARKSGWLPHFHDVAQRHPFVQRRDHKVLFVGALSSSQNIEAIDWYLTHVHPRLKEIPDYRFVVAGGTDGRPLFKSLTRLKEDAQCVLLSDVPVLRPVYAEARVFVNPVQHGAGINSKTIHAVSEGLPVVTTTAGYRGTGLEPNRHLLVADQADAFSSSIRDIFEERVDVRAMVEQSQEFLSKSYDQTACLRELLNSLASTRDAR